MNKVIFLLFLVLSIISCKKDKHVATGSIFVNVQNSYGAPVANVEIFTTPATKTAKTNSAGSLLINDVPVGIYEVAATHSNIGSGVGSVSVKDGDVSDVTIKLVTGTFIGPTVHLSQPYNLTAFVGDEIKFVAHASPAEVTVEWSSNIDGVLNTESPNASGKISFVSSELSEGEHTITIKVTDNESRTAESSTVLKVVKHPEAVVLSEIEVLDDGLSLTWSKYPDADFVAYEIYRSPYFGNEFYKIAEIENIDTVTFLNTNLDFGRKYSYRIAVLVESHVKSESNVQEAYFEFENIDVDASITRMLVDPSRPYLYALDDENNQLLFINRDSKVIEKTIYIGSSPKDMDMNADFSKLYVANNGSSLIAVVDLDSQEKINDLQVAISNNHKPYSIVWLKGNYIAYTVDTYSHIKVVNAETGALVSDDITNHNLDISTNATHDQLYTLTNDGATIYDFNNGTLTEKDHSGYYSYYSSQKPLVTADGAHLFLGRRKFPTNNLSILLGTFDEGIYAINSDGSIAVGRLKIFNGDMFSSIKEMPFSSFVKVISNKTLFSYYSETKKIYLTELE